MDHTPLSVMGPARQLHCDGRETLGALKLGILKLDVYMYMNQFGSTALYGVCMPNGRLGDVIYHVYLDLAKRFVSQDECLLPLNLVTDTRGEVGGMASMHVYLRNLYAPEVDNAKHSAHVAVESTHNTPVECIWNQCMNYTGANLKKRIAEGPLKGIFDCTNQLHGNLDNCMWPTAVQTEIEKLERPSHPLPEGRIESVEWNTTSS